MFTSGKHGWGADIYRFNYDGNIFYICTGYRPFGNLEPSYKDIHDYDNYALKLITSNPFQYDKKDLDNLIKEFILKILDGNKNVKDSLK